MTFNDKQIIQEINQVQLLDKITCLAFVIGFVGGILVASLLHKYIVHPLGW